jgi:GTP cyclohydrolase I
MTQEIDEVFERFTGGEIVEHHFANFFKFLGDDPTRDGLKETPRRVVNAWLEMTAGNRTDPKQFLKFFEEDEPTDEMVVIKDLPVWSNCEHHLLPFFGVASIAYIPKNKVLGLSKFARIVDTFSRRLQVQERLTKQIANFLEEHLDGEGVGVILKCRHLCMESRGVKTTNSETLTSSLTGKIRTDPTARHEFLNLKK